MFDMWRAQKAQPAASNSQAKKSPAKPGARFGPAERTEPPAREESGVCGIWQAKPEAGSGRWRCPAWLGPYPAPRHRPRRQHAIRHRTIRRYQELPHVNPESCRNLVEHGQRGTGTPRFDSAHVGAKQPAAIGQFLLGDPLQSAQLLHPAAQRRPRIDGQRRPAMPGFSRCTGRARASHASDFGSSILIHTHTNSYI
jgi:hypothetical protein